MGAIAVYIIKSAVLLTAMFLAYKLTAGRLKCASLRRTVLLVIYLISLLAPLACDILPKAYFEGGLENLAITGVEAIANVESTSSMWINAALIVMAVGAAIVALMTFAGLIWIARCRLTGRTVLVNGHKVTVVSSSEISPFSFGGHIFLSERDFDDWNEMIIAHEASHVRHRHYLDLLLGRIVAISQWWNPVVWMMLREIKDVHEYQADEDVIAQGFNAYDYQYLLLEKSIGSKFQLMVDCLNHTPLKARLKMINRKGSSTSSRLLTAFCIPAMFVAFIAISSQSFAAYMQPVANAFSVTKNSDTSSISKEKKSQSSSNPDVMIDGKLVDYNSLNTLNPQDIKEIKVIKNRDEHPNGLLIISLK